MVGNDDNETLIASHIIYNVGEEISMSKTIIAVLFLTLSSCATLGPSYPELEDQVQHLSDVSARIVFFRTKESSLFFARSATIFIDEKEVGSCAYGGFFYTDVSYGMHTVKTELKGDFGKCILNLSAKQGEIYYIQVDPRSETAMPFLLGGIIGEAIVSTGKECGGKFKLYQVTSELAKSKIRDLKLSK